MPVKYMYSQIELSKMPVGMKKQLGDLTVREVDRLHEEVAMIRVSMRIRLAWVKLRLTYGGVETWSVVELWRLVTVAWVRLVA